MNLVIKTYVGIFVLLLSVFAMTAVISTGIDVNNARDYHAAVVAEIENANFAPSVISSCETQANANGYELLIDSHSVVKDRDGKPVIMEVILQYEYSMDFYGLTTMQQIRGFAR